MEDGFGLPISDALAVTPPPPEQLRDHEWIRTKMPVIITIIKNELGAVGVAYAAGFPITVDPHHVLRVIVQGQDVAQELVSQWINLRVRRKELPGLIVGKRAW